MKRGRRETRKRIIKEDEKPLSDDPLKEDPTVSPLVRESILESISLMNEHNKIKIREKKENRVYGKRRM